MPSPKHRMSSKKRWIPLSPGIGVTRGRSLAPPQGASCLLPFGVLQAPSCKQVPLVLPKVGHVPPALGPVRLVGVRTRIPQHPVFCTVVTGDPALGAEHLGLSQPQGAHARAEGAQTRVSPHCAHQRTINLTLWQLKSENSQLSCPPWARCLTSDKPHHLHIV